MKSLLIAMLIQIIKSLIGATDWNQIFKAVVTAATKPGLTGAERRDQALEAIDSAALSVGESLRNLAIEAAVQRIKTL